MQSVFRSLQLLEVLSEHQPIGVSELARLCGFPVTTTQRILVTLSNAGWIATTGDNPTRWVLSTKPLIVGRRALGEVGIREVASGPMTDLRDRTHETVNLVLLDGHSSVMIDRIDSDQPVRTHSILGNHAPMHVSSAGRAMLAALPDDEVESIIAGGLESFTPRTITDPNRLREDIARIREVGYALNLSGNRPDVCSIGAAVLDRRRRPVAAISMSMPESRWDPARESEWGALVVATAQLVEHDLNAATL